MLPTCTTRRARHLFSTYSISTWRTCPFRKIKTRSRRRSWPERSFCRRKLPIQCSRPLTTRWLLWKLMVERSPSAASCGSLWMVQPLHLLHSPHWPMGNAKINLLRTQMKRPQKPTLELDYRARILFPRMNLEPHTRLLLFWRTPTAEKMVSSGTKRHTWMWPSLSFLIEKPRVMSRSKPFKMKPPITLATWTII